MFRITLISTWLILMILAAAISNSAVAAQPAESPESVTDSLIRLNGEHDKASDASRPTILARLRNLAAQRHQILADNIESDPGSVLKVALPASLRRGFPVGAREYIEEEVELDGDLEILHEDRTSGSRYIYRLKTRGANYSLHFQKNPPTSLTTGHRVRVRGVRINNALALQTGGSVQVLASALPNTFGSQSTLVILVNFRNNAVQPYTAASANSVVFGTTTNFFLENSYQQTFLSGVVKGWYTLNMDSPSGSCDYSSISSLADAAAQADGVNLASYSRKVYAFPQASGCGWWGLGTVGGNPSRAWVNGSFQLKVVAHEMGHNLGLWHSHSLDCGSSAVCSLAQGMMSEYGDTVDTMGSSANHYNAFQKERLGWLAYGASPPITTAQSAGSYSINPYETVGGGSKALKILKETNPTTGKRTFFYAECRRPLGFDSGLSTNANILNGFVIHTGDEASGDSSYLLDMTPVTSSWSDPALAVGQSFSDPISGITVTPEVPCGDSLTGSINVNFGALACVRANPDITISPAQNQWTTPGGAVSYNLSVLNNDNSGCSPSTFNIAGAVPSGWSSNLSNPALVISPGTAATTNLLITAAPGSTDGLYNINATATNASISTYADMAPASIAVVSSLNLRVSTDKGTYSRNHYVTITTTVSAGGSPVANATVNLTITRPNGAQSFPSLVTGSNGIGTYKFRLLRKDPRGNWQVQAVTTMGGTSVSGATSFTVQ